MFKKVLFGFTAIAVIVVGAIATFVSLQPNEFSIQRSRVVKAAPGAVFGYVNELRQWQAWSPWEHLDPAMQRDFSGPAAGEGATYAWSSDVAGSGRMTIAECSAGEKLVINIDFLKPFEASNLVTFTFTPDEHGTKVVWTMSGTHGFLGKAFCTLMNMDRVVGADFEKGLAKLDEVSSPSAAPATASLAPAGEPAK